MKSSDTHMGGDGERFPLTRQSAVEAARSSDPQVRDRALNLLIRSYWKPMYKYLRIRKGMSNEDAKDAVQGFFAHALNHEVLNRYEPAKAAFRTYLRVCLDAFVANELKAQGRIKRGGDRVLVSLDFDAAETELQRYGGSMASTVEDDFHREWVRGLFGMAVDSLREACEREGKQVHFQLFEQYDLDGPQSTTKMTYESLAKQCGLAPTQVTNHLAWARREFRGIVLDLLRQMTGSDAEFRTEARLLLGTDQP